MGCGIKAKFLIANHDNNHLSIYIYIIDQMCGRVRFYMSTEIWCLSQLIDNEFSELLSF